MESSTTNGEVQLSIQNVVGGYDPRIDVIRDVSLDVERGEICSIIGPNGAGKSTLFRLIYGFLTPKSGMIMLENKDITRVKSGERLRRGICYVPQGRCNFPMMTVRENLEMGAFTRQDDYVDNDIERLMDRFSILGTKTSVLAGNMSGGEQQILEMAMALMLSPTVLMLDEPSLGLAPILVRAVFEEVQIVNETGVTVLIVEQNAAQALPISDHAIVLALGQKRFEGTGHELLADEEVKRLYLGG